MKLDSLITLFLIPFLLISIVLILDEDMQKITGYVAASTEENFVGSYSLNPSFKSYTDYNIGYEYEKVIEIIKNIVSYCTKQKDIEGCFKQKTDELGFKCENPQENKAFYEFFYDFVYKYKKCLGLKEDKVVCSFQLIDDSEETSLAASYRMIISDDDGKTKFELKTNIGTLLASETIETEGPFYTTFSSKDEKKTSHDIIIQLRYTDKKIQITDIYLLDQFDIKLAHIEETMLLYKSNNQLKFIEELEKSSFRIPDLNAIEVETTKGHKFCVKTGKRIYAYDDLDKTSKLRDIVYQVAVTYPGPRNPPPLKELKAEDKLKAEKSIVLKWNKPKLSDGTDFLDFSHFNVYCSKNSFKDSFGQIKLEGIPVPVKSDTNYDLWNAEFKKCGSDLIEDDVDYYFAITVVSNSGKEGKALIEAKAKSIDDLAPGIVELNLLNSNDEKEIPVVVPSGCITLPAAQDGTGFIKLNFNKPTLNEDGITEIKFNEEFDYYVHYGKTIPLENLDVCSDIKKCKAVKQGIGFYISEIFNKNSDINDAASNNKFKEGEKYCFTVVAKDSKGNVIKELKAPYIFEQPEQWKEIASKPVEEIQPTSTELYDIASEFILSNGYGVYEITPELIVAIAKVESSQRHCCMEAGKTSTSSCVKSNEKSCPSDRILSSGSSIGVMQIRYYSKEADEEKRLQQEVNDKAKKLCLGETIFDFDCNVKVGIDILKDKYVEYKDGCKSTPYYKSNDIKTYPTLIDSCNNCFSTLPPNNYYYQYRGIETAVRGYNGWGCNEPDFDRAYVEKVMKEYRIITES